MRATDMGRWALGLAAIGTIGLAGCRPAGLAPAAPAAAVDAPLLQGRVALPGRRLLDVSTPAGWAVSLIDADGAVRAAGVTGADGGFALYKSTDGFQPAPGALYGLEVMTRQPRSADAALDRNLVALRTYVRREGAGWRSLSAAGVEVSLATTVLARAIDERADLAPDAFLGTVAGGVLAALPGVPAAELASVLAVAERKFLAGLDPSYDLARPRGEIPTLRNAADFEAYADRERVEGLYVGLNEAVPRLALPNLRAVTHDATFRFHAEPGDGREDLQGLERLQVVGGWLEITGGANLRSLKGLEGLRRVDTLVLEDLPLLADLSALRNLEAIDGQLQIRNCPALTDLSALTGLKRCRSVWRDRDDLPVDGLGCPVAEWPDSWYD